MTTYHPTYNEKYNEWRVEVIVDGDFFAAITAGTNEADAINLVKTLEREG